MQSIWLCLFMICALLCSQFALPLQARAEGEKDILWNRPSYEKKVIDIGQRILAANGIKERIAFLVDRHDIRNAGASRYGGPNTIVVYKDLLDVISSDDELAAVLSHEIAHIIKRHMGRSEPKRIGARLALVTAFTAVGTAAILATGGLAAPAVMVGGKALKKAKDNGIDMTGPIERPYEKEADLVGLDYMVQAGYNPLAMETLQMKISGDMGPVANFFADHPGGTDRIGYIHEAIKTKYPQFLSADHAADVLPGSPYQLQPATKVTRKATAVIHNPAPDITQGPSRNIKSATASGNQSAASPVSPAAAEKLSSGPSPSAPNATQAAASPTATPNKPTAALPLAATSSSNAPLAAPPPVAVSGSTSGPSVSSAATAIPSKSQAKSQTAPAKVNQPASAAALYPAPPKTKHALSVQAFKAPAKTTLAASTKTSSNITTDAPASSVAQILLGLSPDGLRAVQLIHKYGYISLAELSENFEYQEPETLSMLLLDLQEKQLIRVVGAEPEAGFVLTKWASDALAH